MEISYVIKKFLIISSEINRTINIKTVEFLGPSPSFKKLFSFY